MTPSPRYATLPLLLLLSTCTAAQERHSVDGGSYEEQRERLVGRYLTRGIFGREPIQDTAVLDAMRTVPRHEFVPPELRGQAYEDYPLPIGEGQTISQPYIVAYMTEQLDLEPDDVVFEVGTGSGYQAAVLAEIVHQVYTIEIVPELGNQARETLQRLGYGNVHVRIGDGYRGWPEHAPFDAIIVTAAPEHIPQPLIDQLKPGGHMVIPVGSVHSTQELIRATKQPDGTLRKETLTLVRFVPMTGEAQNENQK